MERMMKLNGSLVELNLAWNGLKDIGFHTLCSILLNKKKCSLESINVSHNSLTQKSKPRLSFISLLDLVLTVTVES